MLSRSTTSVSVPLLAVAMLVVLVGSRAEGAPIRVQFTGVVRAVESGAPPGFLVGQSVRGSFSYDSDAVDQEPNPTFGSYAAGLASFDLSVGSYEAHFSSANLFLIQYYNGTCCVQDDSFIVSAFVTPTLGASSVRAQFALIDRTDTALSSDAMLGAWELVAAFPLDDPKVEHDFNNNWLRFGVGANVRWDVESYSATVPEARLLTGLALAWVVVVSGARRTRELIRP